MNWMLVARACTSLRSRCPFVSVSVALSAYVLVFSGNSSGKCECIYCELRRLIVLFAKSVDKM